MAEKLKDALIFPIEDLSNISDDVTGKMYNTFIKKIEQMRSRAKPKHVKSTVPKDPFDDLEIMPFPYESRIHAFFRMLGLPVVHAEGNIYYSPGFDPYRSEQDKKVQNVDAKINSSGEKDFILKRETDPQNFKNIFRRRDVASVLLTLAQRHPKPFDSIEEGSGDVDQRTEEFNSFFERNDYFTQYKGSWETFFGATVHGKSLTGWRHLIKPITVDPFIWKTVSPATNEVCAPFMPKNASATRNGKNSPKNDLIRPEIENIIIKRMEAYIDDESFAVFFDNMKKAMTNDKSARDLAESIDIGSFRAAVLAIADKNKIDENTINTVFKDTSYTQVLAVTYFTKLIKVCINVLYKSMQKIDEIEKEINWVPLPDPSGPEFNNPAKVGLYPNRETITDLDKRIAGLEIKLIASQLLEKAKDNVGGILKYAFNYLKQTNFGDDDELFSKELNEAKGERQQLVRDGFNALKNIELITGEISGLGLIDIFSILGALWALDDKSLLGLIDDNAFNRLVVFYKELDNSPIIERAQNPQDIYETLQKFEEKIQRFLAYADKELEKQRENPGERESGTVE
jgi:hypothetical protein